MSAGAMKETRPFASLSSSLLARKGRARPAMRPNSGKSLEDLGWNDMGEAEAPTPALALTPAPVAYQAEIEASFKSPVARNAGKTKAAPKASLDQPASRPVRVKSRVSKVEEAANTKSAFTLRLDAERHLRLRLACALSNRSAQKIVSQALDALLDTIPEIDELAGHIPPNGKSVLN